MGAAEGGGLVRYKDGRFRVFGAAEGLTKSFVRVIFEDKNGNLWVGTDRGLFRMQQESLTRIDGAGGIPNIGVHSICEDREGRLLVGGSGLLILSGRDVAYYTSSETQADNSIRTIRQTSDGAIWIGTISGLRRLENGISGNPFATPRLISGVNISVLLESRQGQLWIGAYGQGLMRFHAGRIERFSAPSSLPHNTVLALFDDGEDDIWVGTQGGLLRLSPSAASTITAANGAPQSINTIYQDGQDPRGDLFVVALNGRLFRVSRQTLVPVSLPRSLSALPIRNVFRDSGGALWMGTDGQGIVRFTGAGAVRYTTKQGLVNDFVRAFCEDREGNLWIGTDGGVSRFSGGRFQNFNTETGLAYGSIRLLFLDRSGDLWIGTDGGLSQFSSHRFVADPLLDRLRGQKIWAMHEDADGGLWIGAHGAGLFLFKGERLAQFTTEQGLPSNKIHFIAVVWGSYRLHVRNIRQRFAAVLEERNRLAREMQDTLIQGCVGVSALLEAASSAREVSPSISDELLDRARNEARAAVDEARLAVWNLRESSGSGEDLVKAVSQLAYRTEREMGIPVKFESSGSPLALGAEGEWSLLMIIREALRNSVRHAAPKNLSVLLSFDRHSLGAEIEDDGRGFDPSIISSSNGRHYGLIGMRERVERLGGEFLLTTSPGKGTQIRLRIPLIKPAPLR